MSFYEKKLMMRWDGQVALPLLSFIFTHSLSPKGLSFTGGCVTHSGVYLFGDSCPSVVLSAFTVDIMQCCYTHVVKRMILT